MASPLVPMYRHVFRLRDGETIVCADREAKRTIDKRSEQADPETVWEVTSPAGIIRRLWPEDIASWDTEPVE